MPTEITVELEKIKASKTKANTQMQTDKVELVLMCIKVPSTTM